MDSEQALLKQSIAGSEVGKGSPAFGTQGEVVSDNSEATRKEEHAGSTETTNMHSTDARETWQSSSNISSGSKKQIPRLDPAVLSVLRRIPVNSQLLNGYLTVLNAKAHITAAYHFFEHAFSATGAERSYQSYELMFDRLDSPGSRSANIKNWKVEKGRELFEQWKEWMQNKTMTDKSWLRHERRQRHIEHVWNKMMNIETRYAKLY